MSPSYKVRLAYRTGDVTSVHVLDPVLDPGHRDRLAHVYDGDRLCLYTPGEWDRSMQIATTIIPWTAEWLFHYELWKATDHWAGGGMSTRRADRRDTRVVAQDGCGSHGQRTRLRAVGLYHSLR